MSVRAFRTRKWPAYILSLIVLGSAVWTPTSVYSQAFPGGGGQGAPSSPGVSWPVSDEVFKVCDDGDNTKCVELENTGITTANTIPFTMTGTAVDAVLRLGDGTGSFKLYSGAGASILDLSANSFVVRLHDSNGHYPTTDNAVDLGFAGAANHWRGIYATGPIGLAAAAGSPDTKWDRHSAGVWVARDDTANSIRGIVGGGAAVASAAALPLPTGRVFHVTGTTNVTSITSTNFESGAVITLIFDGVLTFTDGSNLVLAGNFVTTDSDTITLVYDGTSWHETSRSVN